ncbi:hypothetical protein ACBI99_32695 [Nonomuraea sp. ATR24]|uniref:hypothetical protein n=1 Tax=Nonomuraea sp. ATR24 TaxID=1676744 RepID=UPI0035BF31ED
MKQMRRLTGEMLLYCFAVVLATGAYLAWFRPDGGTVVYDGPYEPLRGVELSSAYAAALETGLATPGGLAIRHLHHSSSMLLAAGVAVWVLLGLFRYVPALLAAGPAALAVVTGERAGDVEGHVPHLAAALALGAALAFSVRRESARTARAPAYVLLVAALAVSVVLWQGW